jgi:hypothetical protein
MIATAHVTFDVAYFELQYAEWLKHRSRYRKYSIWFAAAIFLCGVVIAITLQRTWFAGVVIAGAGIYELVVSATYKRRWVNARLPKQRDYQSVQFEFHPDSISSTSENGSGTMQLAGLAGFTAASHGFFLMPQMGVSLYIPRDSILPEESYSTLIQLLASKVGQTSQADSGG